MRYTRQQESAYHEAAHAVAYLYVGEPFQYIEIGRKHCDPSSLKLSDSYKVVSLGRVQPCPEHKYDDLSVMIVCLAGIAAERVMRPRTPLSKIQRNAAYGDYLEANARATSVFGEDFIEGFIQNVYWPQAQEFVRDNWQKIIMLGDQVLKKRKLSYDEVRALLENP
jgi:hypothetical protein